MFPRHSYEEDEALRQKVTRLAAQCNVAEYQFLKSLAILIARKASAGAGVRSCAHWLNFHCGISESAGREKVRVASRLEHLPGIDAAFSRGELSFSKVRAMTRVATPENEGHLLTIARHGTASHLEAVVSKYRRLLGSLEDKVEQDQQRERKLSYFQDSDGMWVIRAKLPPEEGSLVVKALEAVAKPMQQREQQAIMEARKQQNRASAETFSGQAERQLPHSFSRTMAHTKADALVRVAEHFLATCGESEEYRALSGGDRCQVMLHVDIDTLREHDSNGEEQCNLDQQRWVSPATAKRLSCDASLMTVLENKDGKVLNIGRRSRTVPQRMRKALELRDKTCRFPGCCEHRYVDAHHIQHWVEGGETSLDNLVTLCRHHHRLLHRGAFSIAKENNALKFITADGKRMESVIFPQFPRKHLQEAQDNLLDIASTVDDKTCVPRWGGDQPDYGMILNGLLHADRC